ncbi:MAG: hypothetical protein ACBR12_21370 [Microcoleus sp.]|uniref:hypothetical protein n=1 Tax=Microcoleus sp. TaxID=44472 RepID=UPI0035244878
MLEFANQRRNLYNKTTTEISRKSTRIRLEDGKISGMIANHKLASAVCDCDFDNFRPRLVLHNRQNAYQQLAAFRQPAMYYAILPPAFLLLSIRTSDRPLPPNCWARHFVSSGDRADESVAKQLSPTQDTFTLRPRGITGISTIGKNASTMRVGGA